MQNLWPACGHRHLKALPNGWLAPTDAYFADWLARPELALVAASCRAEKALHKGLQQAPGRPVTERELESIQDPDARDSYRHFLNLRNGLTAAGSLQAWYLQLMRSGNQQTPPVFIDAVVQAIVCGLLQDTAGGDINMQEARAAELLFRPQRISFEAGRVLAADAATLTLQQETQGLGDIGRLLAQAKAPVKALNLRVLGGPDAVLGGGAFWADYTSEAAQPQFHSSLLLDLTHELTTDVGHGLLFTTRNKLSGLRALAGVLQQWLQHLLGVVVHIEPSQAIHDAQWRWHVGLDAQASALLNDLYESREVEDERMQRLLSLFKLEFADASDMRRDVAGKPVYLGLMCDGQHRLRLKPQNLLLNLPLARVS